MQIVSAFQAKRAYDAVKVVRLVLNMLYGYGDVKLVCAKYNNIIRTQRPTLNKLINSQPDNACQSLGQKHRKYYIGKTMKKDLLHLMYNRNQYHKLIINMQLVCIKCDTLEIV